MSYGHLAAPAVDVNMPKEIHWLFPSKGFVLYCTEMSFEEPTNSVWQIATCTWNLCKNGAMPKALIDITPDGCLSGCLTCHGMEGLCLIWCKITLTCGLLEKLDPGDSVMAERDFTIGGFLKGKGSSLNIPSFLSKKDQLLAAEFIKTRRIAKLRI